MKLRLRYVYPLVIISDTYIPNVSSWPCQVTDVTSPDLRCYDSATNPTAQTATVEAGTAMGIMSDGTIYHPGSVSSSSPLRPPLITFLTINSVVNVYMAKAPSGETAATFDGSGDVWFKVYQITAVTDGGTSITFPAQNLPGVSFTLPAELPSGDYLVRMEAIALHTASTFGGAQFYVSSNFLGVMR